MPTFATPRPPRLTIESRACPVAIDTDDGAETTIELRARRDDDESRRFIEETVIDQRGDEIIVITPKREDSWSGRTPDVTIDVRAPHRTTLAIVTGSGGVVARGVYGMSSVVSGSGDVAVARVVGSARLRTGSGDVRVDAVDGDGEVRTGSGRVELGRIGGSLVAKSGSGDVRVGTGGTALSVKTGSGDVTVDRPPAEVDIKTASGDTRIATVGPGHVRVHAASGAIRAAVVTGTATWLDVHTVSGRVRSDLEPTPAPDAGQDHLRLELATVSGNIEVARAS